MKVVNQIVTELAVIDVTPDGLVLREIAADTTRRAGAGRDRRDPAGRQAAGNVLSRACAMPAQPLAVILSACRTPIGWFGGALKELSAADLGAVVIREAIGRAGVAPADSRRRHPRLRPAGRRPA